jgi:hypothetical protein
LHYLGITLSGDEFGRLEELTPIFRERLRAFDLDSTKALGTVIWVANEAELRAVIEQHPSADFYLPAGWEGAAERAFLFSRTPLQ